MVPVIKFRYAFKCQECGHIFTNVHTIEELEDCCGLSPWHRCGDTLDYNSCELISRDQWTGLLDKNDNEMYYNDVVLRTTEENLKGPHDKTGIYTVIWDEYRTAWWLKNIRQYENNRDDDYCQLLGNGWDKDRREVIGNVHQNPGLLNATNPRMEITLDQFA